MTQVIYGVCNKDLIHTDISGSERGAKRYATIHGYDIVSIRFVNSGYVNVIARKINNKWVNTSETV